jgi:uncharacterized protein YerC
MYALSDTRLFFGNTSKHIDLLFVHVYILTMANFSELVQELVDAGLSEAKIADATGVSQPTINRVKLGKQKNIGYTLGQSLLDLRTKTRRKSKQAA